MAFSYVLYTGDGTTVDFNVSFDVTSGQSLRFTVDGVDAPFDVDAQLTTITAETAPVAGAIVKVWRETNITTAGKDTVFFDGALLRGVDMNKSVDSILLAIQEVVDRLNTGLSLDPATGTTWDGLGLRITNIDDGTSDTDAVTVQQLNASLIAAGNLPNVTGADNDSGLFVSAGLWAKRTPAQIRTHLALGTAALQNTGTAANNVVQLNGTAQLPAVSGQLLVLSAQADVATLISDKHKNPVCIVAFNSGNAPNDTTATYTGTVGRMDMVTATEINDGGANFTFDAANNNVTLLAGTYYASFVVNFVNSGNITPEVCLCDTAGPAVEFTKMNLGSVISAAIANWQTVHGAAVFTLSSTTALTLRMKNTAAASPGTLTYIGFGTRLEIVKVS